MQHALNNKFDITCINLQIVSCWLTRFCGFSSPVLAADWNYHVITQTAINNMRFQIWLTFRRGRQFKGALIHSAQLWSERSPGWRFTACMIEPMRLWNLRKFGWRFTAGVHPRPSPQPYGRTKFNIFNGMRNLVFTSEFNSANSGAIVTICLLSHLVVAFWSKFDSIQMRWEAQLCCCQWIYWIH